MATLLVSGNQLYDAQRGWLYRWTPLLLTLGLILYNACRLVLTWRVGLLRDEEERSGYSPAFRDYVWLHRAHRFVLVPLVLISLGAFAWNAWYWLWETKVFLPAA